jgi:hypothetical protein
MQPPCFKKVASVALRLQLKEFSEVKYLSAPVFILSAGSNSALSFYRRQGAVIPEIQQADNQTIPDDYADWIGTVDAVYDYQPRDNAMSDPNLWVIKAEERQAWSTEALLIDNNPSMLALSFDAFVDDASTYRLFTTHYCAIHRRLTRCKLSPGG